MKKRNGPPPDTSGVVGRETSQRRFGKMPVTPAGKKVAPKRKAGRGR